MELTSVDRIFIKTINDRLFNKVIKLFKRYKEFETRDVFTIYLTIKELHYIVSLVYCKRSLHDKIYLEGNDFFMCDVYRDVYGPDFVKLFKKAYPMNPSSNSVYNMIDILKPAQYITFFSESLRDIYNKLWYSRYEDDMNSTSVAVGSPNRMLPSIYDSLLVPKRNFGIKSDNKIVNAYFQTYSVIENLYLKDFNKWHIETPYD